MCEDLRVGYIVSYTKVRLPKTLRRSTSNSSMTVFKRGSAEALTFTKDKPHLATVSKDWMTKSTKNERGRRIKAECTTQSNSQQRIVITTISG
jgi:hypothetical protein